MVSAPFLVLVLLLLPLRSLPSVLTVLLRFLVPLPHARSDHDPDALDPAILSAFAAANLLR